MKAAVLPDRGVIKVAGEDARKFLNGLLTADISTMSPGEARFAALLTPQGKIIADCLVVEARAEEGGGFFLDCPAALTSTLASRLAFYRLRAKVTIDAISPDFVVLAAWEGNGATGKGLLYRDPRLQPLGWRTILRPASVTDAANELGASLVDAAEYEAHRIALGVPRGGLDFIYGEAFPHEADMDQLHGVDFEKGCYVGQEVVSRMQHRGTARTRTVSALYEGPAPDAGAAIVANGKTIGTAGSSAQGRGLALARLDRLDDALKAGAALSAGGVALRLVKPDWAQFPWPDSKSEST